MIDTARLSRGHLNGAVLLAASFAALAVAAATACAGEVIIHDRGRKVVVTGADADEIAAICTEFLRGSSLQDSAVSTGEIRYLRSDEVTVEIHYDTPRGFELGFSKEPARGQHLLVPLTGEHTGRDGNTANVFVGRTAPPNEVPYLGFEYANAPDANGVQYGSSYDTPEALEKLRDKVAQLGVDAPRPTPRPTPDLTPMRLEEEGKD